MRFLKPIITAEDNCGEPTVTVNDVIIPGNDSECANVYTIERTWTAGFLWK